MTDLEMVKRCAEKMGFSQVGAAHGKIEVVSSGERFKPREDLMLERPFLYDPLTNDAQAMALVKRFGLWIEANDDGSKSIWVVTGDRVCGQNERFISKDLNRAIVECVSRLPD